MQQRVLVIEDDAAIRRGILHALRFQGYDTLEAGAYAEGLEQAISGEYDLILLDLVLPGGDGLDILKEARARRGPLPVIILTARGEEEDRVRGLKLGADDYVIKPFSVKELLERPHQLMNLPVPGGSLDLGHGELLFEDGTRCPLAEKEADLLRYLIQNQGRVLSRDELLARVWHLNPDAVETRTVDMHIARLREKLRDDPENPRLIVTVRGRGYTFEVGG